MLPKHNLALMDFQSTPARLSGSPSMYQVAGAGIAPTSRDLQSRAHLSMPPGEGYPSLEGGAGGIRTPMGLLAKQLHPRLATAPLSLSEGMARSPGAAPGMRGFGDPAALLAHSVLVPATCGRKNSHPSSPFPGSPQVFRGGVWGAFWRALGPS
jgi:hypothetical protein